jgi:protein-S-isoprenylcysteine O-methyltransferase Ste14
MIGIKIGRFQITGAPAVVVLVLALAGSIALFARAYPIRTNWPLWSSGVLWLVFLSYWNAAATNVAPTKSAESAQSRAFHTRLIAIAFLLLFVPIPGLRPGWLAGGLSIRVAGLAIQTAALLLAVWARRHLGRNWSAKITIAEGHELVRSGPYRMLRHPIYTAMILMFVGTSIVVGTLHGIVAVAVIIAAYWRKIRLEEQNLRNVFGASYDDYRRRTWALIPGVL